MRSPTPARSNASWRALALAALLHAAVLSLARWAPEPVVFTPAAHVADVHGDELAIDGLEPPRAEPAVRPPEAPGPSGGPADPRPGKLAMAVRASGAVGRTRAMKEPPRALEPRGSPSPADEPGASPEPSAGAPSEGGGVLGLPPGFDGRPVWAMPGVLAPLPAATAAPTTAPRAPDTPRDVAGQVLRGTLRTRDRELGLELPAGGTVASAIADAVRSSEAPGDARATFEVRLGPDGNVLGVKVQRASAGSGATWDRVAARAAKAIAARGLRLTGDAAGRDATVTVSIESKVVYPAGTKEKADVEPVCAEEIIEDAIDALGGGEAPRGPAAGPTKGGADAPAPAQARMHEGRRFCIPVGARATFDPSNIGAHMQQVVRSTYTVSVDGTRTLPADVKPIDDRAPWLAPAEGKMRPPPPPKRKPKKRT
jgi:hypothetical protein